MVHDEPDAWFARLRDECPVHHNVERDFYTVTRTADVVDILRHPDRWSSRFRNGLSFVPATGSPMLLDADPPTHTWQRRLLQKAFAPRLINRLESRVVASINELLDDVAHAGRCDFHEVVSAVLPVRMVAELVGVPRDDHSMFKAWSDARIEVTAGTLGAINAAEAATKEMEQYFVAHVAERRRSLADGAPVPDDFTTVMLAATHEDRSLTDTEAREALQLIILGGIETTALLLGNLLDRVIRGPGLAGALRADPSLYEVAVEESLRVDAPTLGLFRTPNADEMVGHTTIPADTKTMVLFAAANRDPAMWDDPDAFRLDRDLTPLRRHFGFGYGAHLCIGAPLARLEGRVTLRAIVERLPNVRYTAPPRRISTMIFRGYDRQPIEWDMAQLRVSET